MIIALFILIAIVYIIIGLLFTKFVSNNLITDLDIESNSDVLYYVIFWPIIVFYDILTFVLDIIGEIFKCLLKKF